AKPERPERNLCPPAFFQDVRQRVFARSGRHGGEPLAHDVGLRNAAGLRFLFNSFHQDIGQSDRQSFHADNVRQEWRTRKTIYFDAVTALRSRLRSWKLTLPGASSTTITKGSRSRETPLPDPLPARSSRGEGEESPRDGGSTKMRPYA